MMIFKKVLGKICDICFLCSFARKHPEGWFGRVMIWHGKWCPAWKSWNEIYGKK